MGTNNTDDIQILELGPDGRKTCRAVLELIIIISAFCTAMVLALTLPDILALPEIEPQEGSSGGAFSIWDVLWICIGAVMVYFWGFTPAKKFLTDPYLQGQRRAIFTKIAPIGTLWGALLAFLFIAIVELINLIELMVNTSEAERSIFNVLCMLIMFMVWRCIEFSMHASFNKVFAISSAKEAPWAWVQALLVKKQP